MNENSEEALISWMENSLKNSKISENERNYLRKIGMEKIQQGYWRGNISETWKSLGYDNKVMHDLYL